MALALPFHETVALTSRVPVRLSSIGSNMPVMSPIASGCPGLGFSKDKQGLAGPSIAGSGSGGYREQRSSTTTKELNPRHREVAARLIPKQRTDLALLAGNSSDGLSVRKASFRSSGIASIGLCLAAFVIEQRS